MLDSGATHNFISEAQLSQCSSDRLWHWVEPMQVRLANKDVVISAKAVTLPIAFAQGLVLDVPFRVMPCLNHPIILGMPWLEQTNPHISWADRTVTIQHDGKHFVLPTTTTKLGTTEIKLCSASEYQQMAKHSRKAHCFAVRVSDIDSHSMPCTIGRPDQPTCTTLSTDSPCETHLMPTPACAAPDAVPNQWSSLVAAYDDVFTEPQQPQSRTVKHHIELVDPTLPVKHHRLYRMSQAELDALRQQLDALLAKGWIKPSISQYNHPILFIRKKTGELRMCIDYRALNANTRIDRYPIPRIDDILDRLHGATIYSKIDLFQGYHQVELDPATAHYTAFQSRFGLYEYTVLPLGLCNAPATFQRLMNDIFRDKLDQFVTVYLDDILVFSKTPEEHAEHLHWVFQQLQKHGLKAKRSKCAFGLEKLEYLGHIISADGISVDSQKTAAVKNCATPSSKHDIQVFLGMCNYYAKFVHGFANLAAPLYALLHSEAKWQWTNKEQESFDALKDALCKAPVLKMPDFSVPFQIETDASQVAVSGVLTQQGRPVCYYSKSLTSAQRNYSTYDRELYAIVEACRRWRHYIDGQRTIVLSDHKPLKHLFSQSTLNSRQMRWVDQLSSTPIDIQYRPGKEAVVPDALSRLPQIDGSVASVIVEPSFLVRLSEMQTASAELAPFRTLATSEDPTFCMVQRYNVPLLVRTSNGVEQLVLPELGGFRQLVLEELHSSPLAGHFGVRKMLNLLHQRVWWPKMRASVATFVNNCDVCRRTKDSTQHPPGALQPLPIPPQRFSSWSLDFITDLPLSHGHNCVLTCVDRLTKYTKIIPCHMGANRLSAVAVAKLFFEHVVRHFGVPAEVIHDRDPRFTSSFWKQLWKSLGSRTLASSAYHPQSDGQTERQHRTIEQVLRTHLLTAPASSWVDHLTVVEFSLNSSVNVSTQRAPFELLYGANVALPVDHALGVLPQHTPTSASAFTRHVHKLVQEARASITKAQEYQKSYYDRHHSLASFQPGEDVLLSTRFLPLVGTRKLAPRFCGPFQVLHRVGDQAYRLALPVSMARLHPTFHVSLLRRASASPSDGRALNQGPGPLHLSADDDDDDAQVYEVDRIVAERRNQYRVRWTGYDHTEDQWIAKKELRKTASAIVAKWEAQKQT